MEHYIEVFDGDIIVWLLIARGFFAYVAAVLMLREPMLCGGKNRLFHRMVAFMFFWNGVSSWTRAYARTQQIVHAGSFLPADLLIFTETVFLTLYVLLVGKLGYDYFQYREFMKIRHKIDKCERCKYHSELLTYDTTKNEN